MKKVLFLLMMLTAFGTIVKAQSVDEKAVAVNCKLLSQGLITRNKALLERLTATKLSYGHSNGDVEDKATFVKKCFRQKTYLCCHQHSKPNYTNCRQQCRS